MAWNRMKRDQRQAAILAVAAVCIAMCVAVVARAQGSQQPRQVRGTVVESASRRPVPGAVVSILDPSGAVLSRSIAGEDGTYSVPLVAGAANLRVLRIGFRPGEASIPAAVDGVAVVDVALTMISTFLEPARVRALQCPRRADAEQAYGLWEQARAGLLAGVVAREQKPPSVVRITYQQAMRGISDEVSSQVIVVDTADAVTNTYRAPFDAATFLRLGFSDDSAGRRYFSAPDAAILLDPAFGNGYCFRIADRDRRRPNQVGLAFTPADRRDGRVDIDGTLWIDTIARSVREIEFTYVHTNAVVERLDAGGSVSFRDMPNGVAFLDRWRLRLPGNALDTIWSGSQVLRVRPRAIIVTGGGEIAHAAWKDSTRFDAPLGALTIDARRLDGTPAAGTLVYLAGTSYGALVDSSGAAQIRDLLPGPYLLVSRERRLAPLHLDSIPTTLAFVAARDSTIHAKPTVPTLDEWVALRCRGGRRPPKGGATTAQTLVLARVLNARRQPMEGVDYVVDVASPASRSGWTRVANGRSDADGLFQVCTDAVEPGQRVGITLRTSKKELGRLEANLDTTQLTIIPMIIKP